jgi:UDP-N-acetylmuramate: L-alanyl-gamma-D-glutamyl-meso-diaminopimelate ligase
MKKVHFIAIGGAVMHNMALALHNMGYKVSGSDDEIFEPAKSRLAAKGLLPDKDGWDNTRITSDLDAIILGMHARKDNPELIRAKELGIKIYSFPEYIYEQSKNKTRIVIGGSHGKTTITAMIMHVMKVCGKDFDYMVGSQLEGFDTMVKLTDSAPFIILEGDEYLTSPDDLRPKFHLYIPHIALLSGIAWDHINVFPTFDNYVDQFRIFIKLIVENGSLIYCREDKELSELASASPKNLKRFGYGIPKYRIENGITILETSFGEIPLMIFGEHNLMNCEGARLVCNQAGISDKEFYTAIQSFKGAAKRLELIAKTDFTAVYKDFAHSPSKLKATVDAVSQQFPDRELVACMELHTFSSLSSNFLDHYKNCMDKAHYPIVYFNPHTIAHKKLPAITIEQVKEAFGNPGLSVYTDSTELEKKLLSINWKNKNLLMMSSGNFDGIDLASLAAKVTHLLKNFGPKEF